MLFVSAVSPALFGFCKPVKTNDCTVNKAYTINRSANVKTGKGDEEVPKGRSMFRVIIRGVPGRRGRTASPRTPLLPNRAR